MTALMRASLKEATRNTQSSHAGLLLTHGLPVWEDQSKVEKSKLIEKITGVSPCNLYQLAFKRWLASTSHPDQFSCLTGTLAGRLMMGLSTGGAMETGITAHHTYGMPMIAGSSVKGAVRAYAETIGLDKQYIAVLFGADDELAKEDNINESAGYLIWHDAWWVPEGNHKPFVGEVVTVHHQEYYSGKGNATDFDSPVPNQQLAVQGSFYFVVQGQHEWVSLAINLLRDTLQQQGVGAKRAAGYGYIHDNTELKTQLLNQQKAHQEQAKKDSEAAKIEAQMANVSDNQKVIMAFIIKLTANDNWKNANPSSDLMGFGTLAKQVETWTDKADINAAIAMFEEQVPLWLKQPLTGKNANANWKGKIKTLKAKVS